MTRLVIGSTLIAATLVAALGAQHPAAPIPYVASVKRNTTGTGGEWELWALDAASGRERRLAALDLPGATDDLRGFSLHPDGTRFATSIALWPYDIWMLEGFEP